MALKQPTTTNTAAPAFEPEDDLETVATPPAAEKSTAVATARPTAVASTASAVRSMNVLSGLKDAFHVEFDSLPGIAASQGSFSTKADDKELGAEVAIQLLSYQDSYVASPNDTKADTDLVKYSDNGVTSKDGVNMAEHVEDLKAQGYSKAKLAHRCVLVGELVSTGNGQGPVGELVMIDLPASGRKSFETYQLQASYAVAKGSKTPEGASRLTLKAVKDKTKSGEIYTKVVVS